MCISQEKTAVTRVYMNTYMVYLKTKQCHNSMQNCPFSMIPKPEWSEFHARSFPEVNNMKFILNMSLNDFQRF